MLIGIKVMRKAKNMTQEQLAEKVKIARTNIARYETGERTPPVKVLARIAVELDTTMDALVSFENNDNK